MSAKQTQEGLKIFLGMEGVEPPTLWFVAIDSHPLSYIPFFADKAPSESQNRLYSIGGRRELNPRMMAPQTITLPLGDARHLAVCRHRRLRRRLRIYYPCF